MNQQISKEAAYVLYKKVQVAVAIFIKKSCPPNKNIIDYAIEFQNEYRKKSKRCNLALERKVFIDQLFHLVPNAGDFVNKSERYPLPMDIDVDYSIDPDYVNFSLKLLAAAEFLDALNGVRLLFQESHSITSTNVFIILSKFGDLGFSKLKYHNDGVVTNISVNVFKQALHLTDIEKVSKECTITIVNLFKLYLFELPPKPSRSHDEAMDWMKKANHVMMKCVDTFAFEEKYQTIILTLLRESIKYTFSENLSKITHYEEYRTRIIRKWKNNKLLCINAINTFIHLVGKIDPHITVDSNDINKCENIFKFTYLFILTYCKGHLKKPNSQPIEGTIGGVDTASVSERHNLKSWTTSIAKFNAATSNKTPLNIKKLGSACLGTLLSTGEFKPLERKHADKFATQ